ncbi:MAG: DUF58 domain-containing protein [Candidatus Omnitrophica bacterium]|nr:DUF58 domain-containing protein [Candidatus Omnitrophota bacterium]
MKSYKMSQCPDNAVTIAPTDRLIFWSSVIFLPLSLLAAINPVFILWVMGISVGFCLLNIIDVLVSQSKLKMIQVILPEVLRLSKDRPRAYKMLVLNEGKLLSFLKISFHLPDGFSTHDNDKILKEVKKGNRYSLNWSLEGRVLGNYEIKHCYLETVSVGGFWSVHSRYKISSQIRVYPNLISAQIELASLFLNRSLGIHSRSLVGKGREFEQLREYIPGDNYEDIHWRATAKRNHPITKTYQLERTQSIYLIIDASRLSARRLNKTEEPQENERSTTILEKYISAALMMGMVSARQGDHFGVLTFSNRVLNFFKANSGQTHFNAVRDALFTLKPQVVSPDFSELFTFIGTKIRHRALLIFLTNLDDPVLSESFIQKVSIINKKHLLLVNAITPRGCGELFSTQVTGSTDDIYERLAGHMIWDTAYKTKKILKSHNVDYSLFDKEHLIVDIVTQYMDVKQRQIL